MRRSLPTLTRRVLPIAITLALAAMAAVALAQVGGAPRARAATVAGTGSFEVADSREGEPIFAATGIAPGGSTSGTVTIEDTGSAAITLVLHRGELVDTPGVGGGVLSGRLQLTVTDITRPAAPRSVYSGPLDSMPDRPAGELRGGEARTYEFTATLPDGGSPNFQNAVQGAATTVAYSWLAREAGGGEGEGGGGGGEGGRSEGGTSSGDSGGNGNSGGTGGNASPPNGGKVAPGAPALDLTLPKARSALRGGSLIIWTNCNMACRLTVRGHFRATVSGVHRGARVRYTTRRLHPPGLVRLRIPVPRALRHWILAALGRAHVRAGLRFVAVGVDGQRDSAHRTFRLRARHRRRA